MDYMNFYSHEQLAESLILFTEGYSMVHRFTIGVIVGAEKILVVDSGLGMSGDLRRHIESVVGADKPMICCCTHGHIDHIASAKQFDEVYAPELDIPDTPRGLSYSRRMSDLRAFSLNNKETIEYGRRHAIYNEDTVFKPIRDGDVFDLGGGVVIELIAVPTHSPGSTVFFNRKEKYALTGDAINADASLGGGEGHAALAKYVQHFIDVVGDDVTFYSGHLPLPQKIGVAKDLVLACLELAEEKIQGDVPMTGIFGPDQTTPHKATGRFHTHGNTLLVYMPEFLSISSEYSIDSTCFYGHEQVSEHIYVVTENASVVHRLTIGVVVGDKEILVIDSGLGMNGELRKYIEGFAGTDKPIICALTHGGIDHIGGISLFDEVYLSSADHHLIPEDNDIDNRLLRLYSYCIRNTTIVDWCRDKVLPIAGVKFRPLNDGKVFDLGGVQVEVVAVPGYTSGSVAFLCRQEKAVFTGDAINADTHLLHMDENGLLEYATVLDSFAERVNDDSVTVYAGHLNRGQTFRTVHNLAAACREVARGETYGDPPGQSFLMHVPEKPSQRLHYHGNTCVVYDRSNFKGLTNISNV